MWVCPRAGENLIMKTISPHSNMEMVLSPKQVHHLELAKIINIGKCALGGMRTPILKNPCSRAGENIILNTLNVTSDMGMLLPPRREH